ncbi:hypothetical protein EJB05_26460 [Eragrostis curvula]|uniref:Uncharacterized protein n=1 Tax=Eragrostis curvula TaxID=38414 RepID=A0A5J9UKV1_9POAL|nr:hypothetical protein EJB05_26460 [Eragrostis curvula]
MENLNPACDRTSASGEDCRTENNIKCSNFPKYPTGGIKRVHDSKHHFRVSKKQKDSQCSRHSIGSCTNGNCPTPTFPDEDPRRRQLIEAKRLRNRAYYANMTLEQRQVRCERQRMQYALRSTLRKRVRHANMTPEQKKAKIDCQKARRKLQRSTLHPESIAMENPMYNTTECSHM